MALYIAQRNGNTATVEDLGPLAFSGYAHFTALQVRGSKIRGLDLHLERLRNASRELFGQATPDEEVSRYLRYAIEAGPSDVSLLATMYSADAAGVKAGRDTPVDTLVRTYPPATAPQGPLSLLTVEHERLLPHIKHVGSVVQTYQMRQAAKQGFDDVAFVDRQGRLSEASIWNLAFWDGTSVLWPQAEMLDGITMQILRRQLRQLGVAQRDLEVSRADLPSMAGAVVLNSWTPGVAVNRIDDMRLPEDSTFVDLMHQAYEAEPLTSPDMST